MSSITRSVGRMLTEKRGGTPLRALAKVPGVSASKLHNIESGKQEMSLSAFVEICEALDCSAVDILHSAMTESDDDIMIIRASGFSPSPILAQRRDQVESIKNGRFLRLMEAES